MEKAKVTIAREPKKGGTCYFLRCLWHIVNDPKTDPIIHWHPCKIDCFVIEDEKLLNALLKTYDAFQSNWNSFRRNLYFYGFSKQKNCWKHPQLERGCEKSLSNIKRKPKKNHSVDQLRLAYMRMILEQQMAMQMNPEFTKEMSSPTNWALPNPPSMDAVTPPELVQFGNPEMAMMPPEAAAMGMMPVEASMPNMAMMPPEASMAQMAGMTPPDLASLYAMPNMNMFDMDPSMM